MVSFIKLDLDETSSEHHQVSGYFIFKFILFEIKEKVSKFPVGV